MANSSGYTSVGAFLWWLFIKQCRTKLADEQLDINRERNFIVFFISAFLLAFIVLKIIPMITD
jgi:hypothetical protein